MERSVWCLTGISLGLGALSSPLVATQFAQLPRWSFHYLASFAVAMVNTLALLWVIRGREMEGLSKLLLWKEVLH
jgi:hypothetical protein